jgi:hypothetical protein
MPMARVAGGPRAHATVVWKGGPDAPDDERLRVAAIAAVTHYLAMEETGRVGSRQPWRDAALPGETDSSRPWPVGRMSWVEAERPR